MYLFRIHNGISESVFVEHQTSETKYIFNGTPEENAHTLKF